jgi:hypothetical protein
LFGCGRPKHHGTGLPFPFHLLQRHVWGNTATRRDQDGCSRGSLFPSEDPRSFKVVSRRQPPSVRGGKPLLSAERRLIFQARTGTLSFTSATCSSLARGDVSSRPMTLGILARLYYPRTSNQLAARKPLVLPLPCCICTLDSDGRLQWPANQSGIRRGQGNNATISGARRLEALIFRGVCATPHFPSILSFSPTISSGAPSTPPKSKARSEDSEHYVPAAMSSPKSPKSPKSPHPTSSPPAPTSPGAEDAPLVADDNPGEGDGDSAYGVGGF